MGHLKILSSLYVSILRHNFFCAALFPAQMHKSIDYGATIMDIGSGAFVLSAAVASGRRHTARKSSNIRTCLPPFEYCLLVFLLFRSFSSNQVVSRAGRSGVSASGHATTTTVSCRRNRVRPPLEFLLHISSYEARGALALVHPQRRMWFPVHIDLLFTHVNRDRRCV